MKSNISEEQSSMLMEAITDKCQSLNLSSTQIIDGLSRSLVAALKATGKPAVTVSIELEGSVEVKLSQ